MHDIPNSEHIFRAAETEKLTDIPSTEEMVEQEIDTKNKSNRHDLVKYILE